MKNVGAHLVKAALPLAAGIMLIFVAGCDYEYELGYGQPYIVPAPSSYYYSPYVGVDYYSYGYPYRAGVVNSYYYSPYRSYSYGWLGYRSPYRSYGRGIGHRGFRRGYGGRRCR
ncbi:MAG: hypothetical protein QGG25_17065 [Phycisphaerae bacterium]|nr:hypothetical protein [Phycisphaerae bacterium]